MPHDESSLLTVDDWRHAVALGASVRALLLARVHRYSATPAAPAWLLRLQAAALLPRLALLEAIAAAAPDRAALLHSHPLFGVPFAVKDNIDVQGLPTTAACPAWAHDALGSATVVHRLLDAGAVLMGKTNLDQFATGLVGTRSPYGAPASTLAPDRVSGGSSSGSAVVVSRGEVAFALGTDTAGSGRVPAGFNHIVGCKPTPGRVSTTGVLPACRSIDCVSVFALTATDAATVLSVIEGADAADTYSRFAPGASALPPSLRVGVPRAPRVDASIGYDSAWVQALGQLAALGAQIVEIDFEPLHAVAELLYDGPWVAERYAAVQPLLKSHPEAFDPTVAAVIQRASAHNAIDAFRGQYRLQAGRQQATRLWADVDVLMVPTAPRHPSFAEVAADPVGANAVLGTYTNFVNLLGWSALALPSCFTAGGLPFGVTFIGPADADVALLRWGQRWQATVAQTLGATQRTALDNQQAIRWPATQATLPLAVVGAHLSGLPLNGQLIKRGATLREATHTAPVYKLHALPGTTPPKPGMQRVAAGGHAIALEVWDMPLAHVGSFLALIPQPLGLGSIGLAGGERVHGVVCESVSNACRAVLPCPARRARCCTPWTTCRSTSSLVRASALWVSRAEARARSCACWRGCWTRVMAASCSTAWTWPRCRPGTLRAALSAR